MLTKVSGSKVIVVMGHSACGAVMGACDGVELGHLTGLLAKIMPAVDATPVSADAQRNASNADFVEAVTAANTKLQVAEILRQKPDPQGIGRSGEIKVVPAMHNLSTGEVESFSEVLEGTGCLQYIVRCCDSWWMGLCMPAPNASSGLSRWASSQIVLLTYSAPDMALSPGDFDLVHPDALVVSQGLISRTRWRIKREFRGRYM